MAKNLQTSTSCSGGNVSLSEYPRMSVAKACHACNPKATELKDPFLPSTRRRRALSSRSRVTSASCPAAINFWTVFLGPEPKTSPQIWWISIDHFSWAWVTMFCDISPATAIVDRCLASTVLLQALELKWAPARPRSWCIFHSARTVWPVLSRGGAAQPVSGAALAGTLGRWSRDASNGGRCAAPGSAGTSSTVFSQSTKSLT